MQICLRKWSRNAALMALFGALFLAGLGPVQAQQKALPALDQKLDPLRTQFNQDVGKVRLIVIVDPTCPPCRWGASEIQKQVLETIPSNKLAVYVVLDTSVEFSGRGHLAKKRIEGIGPCVRFAGNPLCRSKWFFRETVLDSSECSLPCARLGCVFCLRPGRSLGGPRSDSDRLDVPRRRI